MSLCCQFLSRCVIILEIFIDDLAPWHWLGTTRHKLARLSICIILSSHCATCSVFTAERSLDILFTLLRRTQNLTHRCIGSYWESSVGGKADGVWGTRSMRAQGPRLLQFPDFRLLSKMEGGRQHSCSHKNMYR